MNTRFAAVALTLAGTLIAGCASINREPSYLVGDRYFKASMDTQPVIILGVDNWDTTQRRVLVDPGVRVVRVQALPAPGAPFETAEFKLDVKPCFTYYIVAVRPNRLVAQFEPRLDYAEPLGGCVPAAGKG